MKLIDPTTVTELETAQDIITELQVRLMAREQCLDDIARAVEIAEITKQFQLVSSFREAAEEMLKERIEMVSEGDNHDLKVRIYE